MLPGMAADLSALIRAGNREIALQVAEEWPNCVGLMAEEYCERLQEWRQDAADAADDSRFDRALSRAASVRMPEERQEEPEVQQAAIFGQPEPRTKRRRK